jgi:hypothetical protein
MTGLAIVLAVLGAACFAGATVLQGRVVAGAATGQTLTLRGLGAAARRPVWLAGLVLAVVGTTVHAIALVLAPLSIVQPLGVLAVPIAVVLTAVAARRAPGRGVLLGVGACVGGVALFVALTAGTAVTSLPPDGATLVAGLIVAGVVALLAAIGLTRSGWVRCIFCATAGAVAFGLVSALVRAVSQSILAAVPGGLVDTLLGLGVLMAPAGVVAALAVGGWLVQQALASGPPEVVTACLTVVDPIVAVLLGAVLLGEGSATPAGTWVLLAAAALAATAGVVALARHHPDAVSSRAARATPPSSPVR